jgi:pyrimidine deaminase RibD-like protein
MSEHRRFMEKAIEVSRCSKNEDDSGRYPMVGAVVVNSQGQEIAAAYRGARNGQHAEYHALEEILRDEQVAGSTVYTTLEPCTKRTPNKVPCAERLFQRRVGHVVIGMLDPNKDICGRGVLYLQERGVQVSLFDPDLALAVLDINRHFIAYHSDIGIVIEAPESNAECHGTWVQLRGTHRHRAMPSDRLCVFVRKDFEYCPQKPITFLSGGRWEGVAAMGEPGEHTILITRISDDISAMFAYYARVHQQTGTWVSMIMPFLPSGINTLAEVKVRRL